MDLCQPTCTQCRQYSKIFVGNVDVDVNVIKIFPWSDKKRVGAFLCTWSYTGLRELKLKFTHSS
jgi:hypothetical protein